MQITGYLNLYDSYLKTLVETNPTDFTKESLRQAVIDTIHQLTPLRLSEQVIEDVVLEDMRPMVVEENKA